MNYEQNWQVCRRRALSFIEKIEDLDDVQKVYANYDIPEEIGNAL